MVTYKALPAPIICDYLSREASRTRYAPGTEFQIGKIEMAPIRELTWTALFIVMRRAPTFLNCLWKAWLTSTAWSCAQSTALGAPLRS